MRANKLKLNPYNAGVLLVWKVAMQVLDTERALDWVGTPSEGSYLQPPGSTADPGCSGGICSKAGQSDLAIQVYAVVTPWLNYCNALYVGLPLK